MSYNSQNGMPDCHDDSQTVHDDPNLNITDPGSFMDPAWNQIKQGNIKGGVQMAKGALIKKGISAIAGMF